MITSRTIAANGLTFAIDECGDGPDIALCLHGFPESRYSWRYQLPLLAAQGWHAVAPDLRGYGGSTRPEGKAAYHMDHLVADIAGLFDGLSAEAASVGRPAGRRLLVAHDWGALIAWVFASRRVRDLDGLVIMNVPHPKVFRDVLRASWAQKRKSWYALFFQLPWLPERLLAANDAEAVARAFTGMAIDKTMFPPEVTRVYRDNALKPGALTAMINYYRANVAVIENEPAPMIEVPTLMVWGEEDAALDIALTEGYAPLVRDFQLVRLPGVSHWVQQEAPDKVNAAMAEWLAARGLILS